MLLQQLSKSIGFEQYFAVTYLPWTNGLTEVINVTILKYLRSLLSEYPMHESEWPYLILLVGPAIDVFLRNLEHFAVRVEEDLKKPASVKDIETATNETQDEFKRIQSQAYEVTRLNREEENVRRNKKAGAVIQYSPGDYVLVSDKGTPFASKKTRI
eukprot:snap_masked-scaffold_25-processed-gene-3.21-mRNA-1 protein AED:1.00 eAED:1.00 QI:0/0/0/0/1/1/2/0/156